MPPKQPAPLVPDPPDVAVNVCTTCGWPVEPGATCDVDGTVAVKS